MMGDTTTNTTPSTSDSLAVRSADLLSAPTSTDSDSGLLTPSLLTPNTRAEAEFAFSTNAESQTDSAAPATAPPVNTDSPIASGPKSTRRPIAPPRSGSSNYIAALAKSPPGFDGFQAQTYSPFTSGLAHNDELSQVDGATEDVAKPQVLEDKKQSYSQQDLKREHQQHVVGSGTATGYDSVQDTKGK